MQPTEVNMTRVNVLRSSRAVQPKFQFRQQHSVFVMEELFACFHPDHSKPRRSVSPLSLYTTHLGGPVRGASPLPSSHGDALASAVCACYSGGEDGVGTYEDFVTAKVTPNGLPFSPPVDFDGSGGVSRGGLHGGLMIDAAVVEACRRGDVAQLERLGLTMDLEARHTSSSLRHNRMPTCVTSLQHSTGSRWTSRRATCYMIAAA